MLTFSCFIRYINEVRKGGNVRQSLLLGVTGTLSEKRYRITVNANNPGTGYAIILRTIVVLDATSIS
jgi:hypothetical protein